MKILKEYTDGFRWIDGDTSSAPFEKDSDLYSEKLAEGYELVLIPQTEKDAYQAQLVREDILSQIAALDVPPYTIGRACAGDQTALDKIVASEAAKQILRGQL